jgi:hypothetical protein
MVGLKYVIQSDPGIVMHATFARELASCADAIYYYNYKQKKRSGKRTNHSNSKQAEQGRAARSMFSPTLFCILRLLLIIICLNCGSIVGGDLEFMYAGFSGSTNLLRDPAASVTEDGILSLTTTSSFDNTGLFP